MLKFIFLTVARSQSLVENRLPSGVSCSGNIFTNGLKITDGVTAREGSWPWIVSVESGGVFICGGTIIASEWVLTAAHCCDVDDKRFVVHARDPKRNIL